MPVFRPFKGYLPHPNYSALTVLGPEENWVPNTNKLVVDNNPYSFHHVLQAADPSAVGSALIENCQAASRQFEKFVSEQVYVHDTEECFYLYLTHHREFIQTGIIGLSSVKDYNEGRIKKHEHVRDDRVEQLHCFLEHTGLFTTPVFLTYHPDKQINDLIFRIRQERPVLDQKSSPVTTHKLWRINNRADIQLITRLFGAMHSFYIADGHHRAAVAAYDTVKKNQQDGYFLTILIPSNDLTIFPFYRRIHSAVEFPALTTIIDQLKEQYEFHSVLLDQMYYQYLPQQHLLFCMKNDTWLLKPKQLVHSGNVLADLDVSLLQEHIIERIFGINNPKSDKRISFGPLSIKLEDFKKILQNDDTHCVFIPRAPRSEDIFAVADINEVMPPKSTSFEPKIKSGLVLYKK